ncbi:MAG: hypothetical protein AAF583_11360 [Pseudomonadota bacterium]
MVEGAAYGAAHGAGAANGQNLGQAAEEGAVIGGLLGGPLAAASGGLSRIMQRPGGPTKEALRMEAQRLYAVARKKNPSFPNFDSFARATDRRLTAEGFDPALHPRTKIALRETLKRGLTESPDLQSVEGLRKITSAAAKGAMPDDARLTKIIRDGLDTYVERNAPVPELREARAIWRRVKSSETLEEIALKASLRSQGGDGVAEASSLRSQLRTLLENPRRRAGFTTEELKAIEEIVRGGPADRFMRMLSSLSPSAGRLPLFANIGAAQIDPAYLTVGAAGAGARALTDAATRAATQRIAAGVRKVPKSQSGHPGLKEASCEALRLWERIIKRLSRQLAHTCARHGVFNEGNCGICLQKG